MSKQHLIFCKGLERKQNITNFNPVKYKVDGNTFNLPQLHAVTIITLVHTHPILPITATAEKPMYRVPRGFWKQKMFFGGLSSFIPTFSIHMSQNTVTALRGVISPCIISDKFSSFCREKSGKIVRRKVQRIGHFRVALKLIMKARLLAQFLL